MGRRRPSQMLAALAWVIGCGDADGPVGSQGALSLYVAGIPLSDGDTVFVSPVVPVRIVAASEGMDSVRIVGVTIESEPPGALRITSSPWPSASAPIRLETGDEHELLLSYTPPADGAVATATIRLATRGTFDGRDEVLLHARGGLTRLLAFPRELDFGGVEPGTRRSAVVSLRNDGQLPVRVTRAFLDGPHGFSMIVHGVEHRASVPTEREGIAVSPPLELAPGASVALEVSYAAGHVREAFGSLRVVTDELPASDGLVVPLYANVPPPCLHASLRTLDFGGQPVGSTARRTVILSSCGGRPVEVRSLALDDPNGVFSLEAPPALPVTLAGEGRIELVVTYTPQAAHAPEAAPDRAALTVASSGPPIRVPLQGFGTRDPCPTARIDCGALDVVEVGARLQCSGASSTTAAGGPVSAWRWALEGPGGMPLAPSPSAAGAVVETDALAIGDYRFTLDVWDEAGVQSCRTASFDITVVDEGGLRIELRWRTPGDAVETDEGFTTGGMSLGSDLDLHLLHPNAEGYFDGDWDVSWLAPNPGWAGAGSSDDPVLVRDDSDGGGPEVIRLDQPEAGATYTVGVHYWDDWGYGAAHASVLVFVNGALAFERQDVMLVAQDMWHVCTIDWPSGVVRALGDGEPDIEASYPVPLNAGLP